MSSGSDWRTWDRNEKDPSSTKSGSTEMDFGLSFTNAVAIKPWDGYTIRDAVAWLWAGPVRRRHDRARRHPFGEVQRRCRRHEPGRCDLAPGSKLTARSSRQDGRDRPDRDPRHAMVHDAQFPRRAAGQIEQPVVPRHAIRDGHHHRSPRGQRRHAHPRAERHGRGGGGQRPIVESLPGSGESPLMPRPVERSESDPFAGRGKPPAARVRKRRQRSQRHQSQRRREHPGAQPQARASVAMVRSGATQGARATAALARGRSGR
jgi:hypothetical protein